MKIRALLDHAAESSFVSERVAQILRLKRTRTSVQTVGLEDTPTGEARTMIQVKLRSPNLDSFNLPWKALVMPKISGLLPSSRIALKHWRHLEDLSLADPEFSTPNRVGLSTVFGWITVGSAGDQPKNRDSTSIFHCTSTSLSDQLQRLWEVEEVAAKASVSAHDQYREKQFRETHFREKDGRYVVRLPVIDENSIILSTERRLAKNTVVRDKYVALMGEYTHLGHIDRASSSACDMRFYLPHHTVFPNHDPSGKIRVVFNASAKSSSGYSLNDKLLAGPKLQSELWIVLSHWRLFEFAFTTDIVKMFRQIKVNPADRDLQRILWRENPSSDVAEYQLSTVTYGTAPAPFLALRDLLQLAKDEEQRFSLGAQVARVNSYVDDIFAGADCLEQTSDLQKEVVEIFTAGQFPLGKWAASNDRLFGDTNQESISFCDNDVVSVLGLSWDPLQDVLSLKVSPFDNDKTPTKWSIVSSVAKLFDPFGWVSPMIILPKILIQDLWIAGASWDEPTTTDISSRWLKFRDSLRELEGISVLRWMHFARSIQSGAQLHGFCDASKQAYAACIYLRTVSTDGRTEFDLLVAKTKVAPVKAQTIPRLELIVAVLLTRLLVKVQSDLSLNDVSFYAWTD